MTNFFWRSFPYFLIVLLCAGPCLGVTVEEQLEKVRSIAFGPFIRVGMGVATIVAAITAAARGSLAMAGGVIGVGLALSYYFGWLNTHNFMQ